MCGSCRAATLRGSALAHGDFLDLAHATLGVGVDEIGGCLRVLPQQLQGRTALAERAAASTRETERPRPLDEEEAVERVGHVTAVELLQPGERTQLPGNGLYRQLLVGEEDDVGVFR